MTFPAYPEYKRSGIDWLQEVPKTWEIKPLKYLLTLNPRKSEFNGDKQQVCSFVPMEKLKTGEVILDEQRPIEEVIGGYTFFQDGDVLQAKVTPCFENKNVALAERLINGVGFGSSEINVLRPSNQVDSKYLFYRLQEDAYMEVCTSSMIGAGGLRRVPSEVINNFAVAVPPIEEQRQVSRFLDHETAKIDALIQEQERLIELLQEKHQAVISHAVTKGLDPDVPMKDSGVEWLGEVPAHWRVGKLRWYATIQGGVAKGKDYEGKSTVTLPYLRVANVQAGYVDLTEVKEIAVLHSEVDRYSLKSGDVLMNEGGDNDKLGRGTVWKGELDPCLHQNHVFAIRPNEHLSSDWLAMFTQSGRARSYFYLNSKQSTNLASISSSNVMNIDVPMPPVQEQQSILQALNAQISQFAELQTHANSTISLLAERRSALISAAVTGKIDVRCWQPPANESAFDEEVRQAGLEVTE